ncbi:protein of unknown function [Ruminococcaceae bacterium BL-6]|nr:protein of unknown function [Ruminococcaceae bacterium BL-6]
MKKKIVESDKMGFEACFVKGGGCLAGSREKGDGRRIYPHQ